MLSLHDIVKNKITLINDIFQITNINIFRVYYLGTFTFISNLAISITLNIIHSYQIISKNTKFIQTKLYDNQYRLRPSSIYKSEEKHKNMFLSR